MRHLTLILTLLFFCVNHAKAQIDAGTDVIICDIEDVDLSADYTPNSIGTSDYTIENIPIDIVFPFPEDADISVPAPFKSKL